MTHGRRIPIEFDEKMPCVRCGVNLVDTTQGDLICNECKDREKAENEETENQLIKGELL